MASLAFPLVFSVDPESTVLTLRKPEFILQEQDTSAALGRTGKEIKFLSRKTPPFLWGQKIKIKNKKIKPTRYDGQM